jgi:hypothetical protein
MEGREERGEAEAAAILARCYGSRKALRGCGQTARTLKRE